MCNVMLHYIVITSFMNILTCSVYSFCMKPELSFTVTYSFYLFCCMGKNLKENTFRLFSNI